MFATLCGALRRRATASLSAVGQRLLALLKPATGTPVGGALGDLARTKAALLTENALLRQQLVVLRRQVARPALTPADRLLCWPSSPSPHGIQRSSMAEPPPV